MVPRVFPYLLSDKFYKIKVRCIVFSCYIFVSFKFSATLFKKFDDSLREMFHRLYSDSNLEEMTSRNVISSAALIEKP